MGAIVSGNFADLDASQLVFDRSGDDTISAHNDSVTFANNLQGEVDDVTNTLLSHFNGMADELRGSIANTKATFEAAGWEGTSRQNALQAEATLNTQVDTVLTGATTAVDGLRSFLMARIDEFVTDVTGDFGTVMTSVEGAYRDLAGATRAFTENLDLADQTIRLG